MARRVDDMDIGRSPEMPPLEDSGMSAMVGGTQVTRRGNRAVVDFAPGMDRYSQDDGDQHSGNILDMIDENQQGDLANKIIDWVEIDLDSRKDWQRRMDQAHMAHQ